MCAPNVPTQIQDSTRFRRNVAKWSLSRSELTLVSKLEKATNLSFDSGRAHHHAMRCDQSEKIMQITMDYGRAIGVRLNRHKTAISAKVSCLISRAACGVRGACEKIDYGKSHKSKFKQWSNLSLALTNGLDGFSLAFSSSKTH